MTGEQSPRQRIQARIRAIHWVGMAKAEAKMKIEDILSEILDLIAAECGQPDAWESQRIAGAIGAVSIGFYRLAAVDADLAFEPPSDRVARQDVEVFNLQRLRSALDYVRGVPAHPW